MSEKKSHFVRVAMVDHLINDSGGDLSAFAFSIDSYPLCAAYMRQRIGSALFQIMACRLFGAII